MANNDLESLIDREISVLMGGWSAEREISLKTGKAVTDLRPSGRIAVNDTIYDATTTGQWISEGATVRIMHTGMTIEVEEVLT